MRHLLIADRTGTLFQFHIVSIFIIRIETVFLRLRGFPGRDQFGRFQDRRNIRSPSGSPEIRRLFAHRPFISVRIKPVSARVLRDLLHRVHLSASDDRSVKIVIILDLPVRVSVRVFQQDLVPSAILVKGDLRVPVEAPESTPAPCDFALSLGRASSCAASRICGRTSAGGKRQSGQNSHKKYRCFLFHPFSPFCSLNILH